MLKLLAFDYGASSGRAILGKYDGEKLLLEELHRFSNDPVMVNGTFHWDVLRLFHEMKQGIIQCGKNGNRDIAGIGVDTWGVDFGLLGHSGELLGNPVHYRDERNNGMMEETFKIVPKKEIYQKTGIQFMQINTLYQLVAMKRANSSLLEKADTLLLMPDLFNYFLTGEKASEFTIASTTQMLDWNTKAWAGDVLERLGVSKDIMTGIINPGSIMGRVSPKTGDELRISGVPVIAVAEHDTASAVMAVPSVEGRYAYLSSGTWSLLGLELENPVINDSTYQLNFTNEGGYGRTARLLKNIMGLWIYQECKRTWDKEGENCSFDRLEAEGMGSKPFEALIDPDDEPFLAPGNMPDKIRDFCRRTGQTVPETKGAIVRCIMESLALKYRMTLDSLEEIAGFRIPVMHIVGGGCKNVMLCQFTANAIGRPVIAGPIEATAIGNLICQMIALGEIASLKEARILVKKSFPTTEYLPGDTKSWNDAYLKFKQIGTDYRMKGV